MLSGLVVYPAAVTTSPTLTIDRCKLIVQDGVATVWQVVDRQITEVARLENVVGQGVSGRSTLLRAEDGTIWSVAKGNGCGCGSPLKRWMPEGVRPLRASR
jgi:hypothetical protein